MARHAGRGTGIFLHVNGNGATAGCVSVPRATMDRIMGWITPSAHLLTACTTCNGWFEDNPRESYERGWKVRRPQLPTEVLVMYSDGREFRLTSDWVRSTTVAAAR